MSQEIQACVLAARRGLASNGSGTPPWRSKGGPGCIEEAHRRVSELLDRYGQLVGEPPDWVEQVPIELGIFPACPVPLEEHALLLDS